MINRDILQKTRWYRDTPVAVWLQSFCQNLWSVFSLQQSQRGILKQGGGDQTAHKSRIRRTRTLNHRHVCVISAQTYLKTTARRTASKHRFRPKDPPPYSLTLSLYLSVSVPIQSGLGWDCCSHGNTADCKIAKDRGCHGNTLHYIISAWWAFLWCWFCVYASRKSPSHGSARPPSLQASLLG